MNLVPLERLQIDRKYAPGWSIEQCRLRRAFLVRITDDTVWVAAVEPHDQSISSGLRRGQTSTSHRSAVRLQAKHSNCSRPDSNRELTLMRLGRYLFYLVQRVPLSRADAAGAQMGAVGGKRKVSISRPTPTLGTTQPNTPIARDFVTPDLSPTAQASGRCRCRRRSPHLGGQTTGSPRRSGQRVKRCAALSAGSRSLCA